ncbi:MAG: sulfur carrier protein ThiS [Tepidisphaeraceae bacterium]
MKVIVNGEARQLESPTTVRQIIEAKGLLVTTVAVELNRRLLKTERYDTELKDADEVEIVTFVGGG